MKIVGRLFYRTQHRARIYSEPGARNERPIKLTVRLVYQDMPLRRDVISSTEHNERQKTRAVVARVASSFPDEYGNYF